MTAQDNSSGNGGWLPIETAPKDGTRILLARGSMVVCGHWYDDHSSAKPRPYWMDDRERILWTRDMRANPPTHWQPLPVPPSAA